MTDRLPVEILLYHNGRRMAGAIYNIDTYQGSVSMLQLDGMWSVRGYRLQMECRGEAFPGWLSYLVTLSDAEHSPITSVGVAMLVFTQPAQFPSVLVLPSRAPDMPGALTLVTQVPGPIKAAVPELPAAVEAKHPHLSCMVNLGGCGAGPGEHCRPDCGRAYPNKPATVEASQPAIGSGRVRMWEQHKDTPGETLCFDFTVPLKPGGFSQELDLYCEHNVRPTRYRLHLQANDRQPAGAVWMVTAIIGEAAGQPHTIHATKALADVECARLNALYKENYPAAVHDHYQVEEWAVEAQPNG